MRKVAISIIVPLSLIVSINATARCDVEDIMKDKIELQLSYNKEYKYESAVIKHYSSNDFGSITGEIVPDRAWNIKNINGETIGYITDDLNIKGMDDDCVKIKLSLKKSKDDKYQIVKNGAVIGEINGKLPREY